MFFPIREDIFNYITDKLSDFLIITDLHSNIISVNKTSSGITGMQKGRS